MNQKPKNGSKSENVLESIKMQWIRIHDLDPFIKWNRIQNKSNNGAGSEKRLQTTKIDGCPFG